MSASSPPAPAPTSPPSPPLAPSPSNSTSPPPSSPPPAPSSPNPIPSPPPSSPPPSPSPPSPPSSPSPSSPSPPTLPSSPSPSSPSPPTPPSSPSPSSPSPPSPPSSHSPPPPSTGRSPPVSPSPPSAKTPPSSVKSPPPPSPSPSNSSSISAPLVVGIAVAAVAVLVVLTVAFFCCKKKKKRQSPPPDGYPPQQPAPPLVKDDFYGGQVHNWQHNAPPPAVHVVKIPSDPSPPPPYPSRLPNSPFLPPPPPPPPVMSSSGGSGSNYSGSDNPLPPSSPGIALGFPKGTFTFDELVRATDGFSDANLLGQGGFGFVHKGILPNGKEVAIKQLKTGSGQGESEFQAEVGIISRVHHKNLVTLVGYCSSGGQRLLVYEFVPNRTLEFHLHGEGQPTMDWPIRLRIALGSARGLAYLHEDCHPKIIHRDIKAANILLEHNFEAKVADFGLAKFSSDDNTHISTRVMGTFGYLAPEYASSGKLTEKSDVFSYGVMLLELITGRRPVDSTYTFMDDSLVDWARPLLTRAIEDGDCSPLIDPKLGDNYVHEEMARMIACAAACVRHSAKRRPRMGMVVRTLERSASLEDLNDGITPGHSSVYSGSDYDANQYKEDMKKFRKLLDSGDYAGSEYSAPTSEYGQNPSASSSEGQQTQEMEMNRLKKYG